jgi:hypothetical protein
MTHYKQKDLIKSSLENKKLGYQIAKDKRDSSVSLASNLSGVQQGIPNVADGMSDIAINAADDMRKVQGWLMVLMVKGCKRS